MISELLPHSGAMVLLDAVETWDAESIHCSSWSHLRLNNPLRRRRVLGAAAVIEYAAQAMALHGALLEGEVARPGMVAAARGVRMRVPRLDGIFSELAIHARLLTRNRNGARYAFEVAACGSILGAGEVTVAFRRSDDDAPSLHPS